MTLDELDELWGIPLVHLKEYSKRYRLYSWLIYLLDVVIVFGLTAFMFFNNISYQMYGFVIVVACVVVHFLSWKFLNINKWIAFKFYRRHRNGKITKVNYDMDAEKMYSVLYCVGYKRLKTDKSLKDYQELAQSACCEDIKYSKSIAKYLHKYEFESGNVTCYIMTSKNKEYFIGITEGEE